jgi:hypothetical protein
VRDEDIYECLFISLLRLYNAVVRRELIAWPHVAYLCCFCGACVMKFAFLETRRLCEVPPIVTSACHAGAH